MSQLTDVQEERARVMHTKILDGALDKMGDIMSAYAAQVKSSMLKDQALQAGMWNILPVIVGGAAIKHHFSQILDESNILGINLGANRAPVLNAIKSLFTEDIDVKFLTSRQIHGNQYYEANEECNTSNPVLNLRDQWCDIFKTQVTSKVSSLQEFNELNIEMPDLGNKGQKCPNTEFYMRVIFATVSVENGPKVYERKRNLVDTTAFHPSPFLKHFHLWNRLVHNTGEVIERDPNIAYMASAAFMYYDTIRMFLYYRAIIAEIYSYRRGRIQHPQDYPGTYIKCARYMIKIIAMASLHADLPESFDVQTVSQALDGISAVLQVIMGGSGIDAFGWIVALFKELTTLRFHGIQAGGLNPSGKQLPLPLLDRLLLELQQKETKHREQIGLDKEQDKDSLYWLTSWENHVNTKMFKNVENMCFKLVPDREETDHIHTIGLDSMFDELVEATSVILDIPNHTINTVKARVKARVKAKALHGKIHEAISNPLPPLPPSKGGKFSRRKLKRKEAA